MATASEHRARARGAVRENLASGVMAELLTDQLLDQALDAARSHLTGWLAGDIYDELASHTHDDLRLPLDVRSVARPDPGEHLWAVTGQWHLSENDILRAGLGDAATCALCFGHYGLVGRHLCHANLIREQAKAVTSSAGT